MRRPRNPSPGGTPHAPVARRTVPAALASVISTGSAGARSNGTVAPRSGPRSRVDALNFSAWGQPDR
jgi:hypothetical protein